MIELDAYLAKQSNKTIAVAVHDFESGEEILCNAEESFHPASTIKVHVMMEVFHQAKQGLSSLDDCIAIHNSFHSIVDGGLFSLHEDDDAENRLYPRIGENESVREMTRLMIVRSSNLATNILLDRVGAGNVNALIQLLGIQPCSRSLPRWRTRPAGPGTCSMTRVSSTRRVANRRPFRS